MRIQCSSCGFSGLFAGGGVRPSSCPVCRSGRLTEPVATSPCPHCGGAFAIIERTCPHCGVEKVKQEVSRESGKLPIPDGSPPPPKV